MAVWKRVANWTYEGLDFSFFADPEQNLEFLLAVRISTPLHSASPSRQAAAEALLLDFYRSLRPKLDLVGF